jgi:hypothetical protein
MVLVIVLGTSEVFVPVKKFKYKLQFSEAENAS